MKKLSNTEAELKKCVPQATKKIGLGNLPSENFLSPTRPHKSNMYVNIYFLFQKYTHTNKKISTGQFICRNLHFFPFKQKKKELFVYQRRKVLLEQFLSVNFILKIQLNLYKNFFCSSSPGEDFFGHPNLRKPGFFWFFLPFKIKRVYLSSW